MHILSEREHFEQSGSLESIRLFALNDVILLISIYKEFHFSSVELRTSSFELRTSSFELRTSRFELRSSSFELKNSSFELKTSSFELKLRVSS